MAQGTLKIALQFVAVQASGWHGSALALRASFYLVYSVLLVLIGRRWVKGKLDARCSMLDGSA